MQRIPLISILLLLVRITIRVVIYWGVRGRAGCPAVWVAPLSFSAKTAGDVPSCPCGLSATPPPPPPSFLIPPLTPSSDTPPFHICSTPHVPSAPSHGKDLQLRLSSASSKGILWSAVKILHFKTCSPHFLDNDNGIHFNRQSVASVFVFNHSETNTRIHFSISL